MKHLRQYITSQGQRLAINSIRSASYTTLRDVVGRLNYASVMMGLLTNPEAFKASLRGPSDT